MANNADVTIKLKAQDEASRTMKEVGNSSTAMGMSVQKAGMMAAAAFAAVGAGALALIDKSLEMNAQLEVTGYLIGETGEDLRGLALDLSNVTFELDSVINSLRYLSRTQLVSNEMLGETATAWDTMGDASGMLGEKVMKLLIPAFIMFDKSIEKPMDTFDMFTNIINTSTTELANLGRMISSQGQYIIELGLTFEDLFLAIKGLAERGEQGRGIVSGLSAAMSEATTSARSFWEIIGLNRNELEKYLVEMEEWKGSTQDIADLMNTQYSLFDRLKQKIEDLGFMTGSAFQSLEWLFGIITSLAPIMLIFAVNTTLAAGAVRALGAAIKIAMGPVGWIILGIGLLIGAVKLLIHHWDTIKEAAAKAWNAIWGVIETVIGYIVGAFNAFKETAITVFETIGKVMLTSIITPFWIILTLIDKVIEGIKKIPWIGTRLPGINEIGGFVNDIQDWIGEHSYLPNLQHGGIATQPMIATIAEREPEAVIPLSQLSSFGGAITIPIYLDGRLIERAVVNRQTRSATLQGVRSRWT